MSDSEEEDRGGGLLVQEAEESSEDSNSSSDSDSEEEEEEEGGEGEGDLEGLIDDNVEEREEEESGGEEGSGEESDDEIKKKEKRKRNHEDDQLDDEDYALIAENTGIQLQRKKLRRVHMLDSDEEDEGEGLAGESAVGREPAGGTPLGDEEDLSNDAENFSHIFGDSDEEEAGESQGSGSKKLSYLDDIEDDEDGFIVDEQGRPLRRRKGDGTYSEPALMEAQDVFGLDFDPAEFEKLAREGLGSGDEEEEDEDQYEEEDSDLEGEDGETPKTKKRHRRKAKKKTGIYDLYEPSELERGHFLERDAEIRVTDMPERFQTRSIPVKPSEEGELEEEAEWVFEHAFVKFPISKQPFFSSDRATRSGGQRSISQQVMVPKIKEALNFMRNHSFEVPYIANYRREYIEPDLDIHDLWKIYHWDEKWMQLKTRKQDMHRLFERMRDYQFEKVREEPDKALTEDTRVLTDEDIMRLESVSSPEELSDVYAHFTLYYGKDMVAMRNRQAKKPSAADDLEEMDTSLDGSQEKNSSAKKTPVKQAHRRDFYAICQENGLGSLAAKYGLTPEQFGENLRDNYQRHETEQHNIEPEEAAEDYVQPTGYFSSVRAVLQGACHMVAMQIASEPLVRQSLRQAFQTRAVVSVKPTKKGRKMIDDSHPCFSMKYLRNKALKELKGDEFLKLVQAEEDRLIEMKISIDRDLGPEKRMTGQTYFEDIRQLFYRDEFSRLVEKWNAQRAQAVAHALLKVLYPLMEKEMRNKLLTEAKEHVLQSCVHKFRKWLDIAPPTFTREEDSVEVGEGPYARVLACAYTPDKNVPAFCCFLDGSGQVTDFLRLNNLLKRKYSPFDREREEKEGDLKNFKEFVSRKRPDVIVVGAESRECLSIVDEFRECLTELEQETDVGVVRVELMDPNVARIYSKTNRAAEEFPEYPELLRMAVSLGRRMQEPLHEFTALASSPDDEIFALKMDPLQDSVPKEKLRDGLELELVTRVNDVGVDVNFALNFPHASNMLNYVCGLGPRKAAALLKTLKQENAQLQNRSQLVMQCSFGPHLFINCVGFIKIDYNSLNDQDSTYIEVLDSTRIHPETYVWARKMAVDALEYDEVGDENNPSGAVEEILMMPDKLSDLDLDAFAEELERQDYGNKKTTLYDIRNELFAPFKERRDPYTPMTEEEKFSLLTGETPESLHEGKLVICTVVGIVRRKPTREVLDRANPIQNEQTHLWQCPFCLLDNFRDLGHVWQHFDDGSCPGQGIGVRTRLENGLSGFIHTRNLSDKHVSAPEERVHIGMAIHCRILRVNLEKFSVDLTCKSSDLSDNEGRFSLPKDMYYDHDLAEADRKKEEGAQKKPQQKYFKRVIVHPSFMNCSFSEAERALSKMDQGDAVFRPSSKGSDRLTLTWKLDDGIHIHVDIKEQNKPNQFSLGKSLWIGNDEFEDLDEILARYVQPVAAGARDMLSHKCYRKADGGNAESLKKLLQAEKNKNPKRIPYFFSASKRYPGKFCLAYQPGSKPRIEYLTVTVDGFRYRNKTLATVNELIKWFKEHFQDPIPRPAPSTGAMTGSQIPSHITQNVDPNMYSKLPSGAHPHSRGSSNTPYTPTHLAYSTGTPTPQYAQHQQPFPQQPYHGGGYGGGSNQYGGAHPPYGGGPGGQFGYQRGGAGGWGGGPQPGWTPSQSAMMRTPAQTPGRTPAYTPTQTPRSINSSLYTPSPRSGGHGHRHTGSPIGTPLLDE